MNVLSRLYAHATRRRRQWYARPDARRRLASPVISIGNLAAGGSGKTPLVAYLARTLHERGLRPAILSRGYARRTRGRGVVVVSDGTRVLERAAASGDEPQLLARSLPGVPVLVCADRHAAGLIAEERFGCNVHLLDDGFQHVRLARDIDLVLVAPRDLDDEVFPAGRLREPLDAAAFADAVIASGNEADVQRVQDALRPARFFRLTSRYLAPRLLSPFGTILPRMAGARALAVAGIARPERFFDALRSQGWDVVRQLAFRDHHWFDAGDLKLMLATARAAQADVILTTEKDAMRLVDLPLGPIPRTFGYLPMEVVVEPQDAFVAWLQTRIEQARAGRTEMA